MADEHPVFNSLDREAEVEIRSRNLPHWFQPDATIFVTFRAADSLPKAVVNRMQTELEQWLLSRGYAADLASSVVRHRRADHAGLLSTLCPTDAREFQRLLGRLYHGSLDECHGRCLLRTPSLAEIVAQAIRHDDGVKFDLDRFVIMPNHVHVLAQFRAGFNLSIVGQSWMRYSARQINQAIGESGAFWQAEPFDHIVRSAEQFRWLQKYITDNPAKAKLKPGEYIFWSREQSD